ncbi:MAG: tetratricopeptide repeat protein [Bacteroidota bacterium]|jgi:tetratricopeptide (TPR) repeat protein
MKILSTAFLLCLVTSSLTLSQTNIEKAKKLFDEGKPDESKALFEQVIKESPDTAEAYYYLGVLAIDNDYDEAIDYLEKATQLDNLNARYRLMLGNAYGTKAARAGIFKKFGAAADCLKNFELAVQLDPKYIEARSSLIQYYLQAPGIMGGSVKKARTQADTIGMLDAYEGYLENARVHQYEKELNEAEQSYLKAISVDSKKLPAYQALWSFYLTEKNEDKAAKLFSRAIHAVDKRSELYLGAGIYYVEQKNFGSAREMLHAALKEDSTNLPVYYQLGKAALFSGEELENGLSFFETYVNGNPPRNAPSRAHAHWRMGLIYEKLGKKEEARSEYRKSLELNSRFEEAKKALEALK